MANTVTIDDKNVATIDMVIDSKVAKDIYDRTLKAYGSNVNIAGFRKGKAPVNIVEKFVGAERIKAEVIDRIFPTEFQKVVDENKLNIAYRPTIQNLEFNVGEDVKLQATVELKPNVKLGKYKDVEIKFDEFKNEENALEKELEQTQRRFSTLNKVDRKSTDKDTVVFDFEGFVGDEKIEHGDAKNYSLDLANSNFIPGFAQGLVNHQAGEEFDINVTFPENYHEEKLKGANAVFKIKLHEVKERQLPELNDELAKKAGKKTIEELKEDIQKYLDTMAKNQNDKIKSDAIFEKIYDTTKIDIQQSMLDREYEAIMAETKANIERQGGNFEQMVEKEGKDKVEENFKKDAETRIKNSLIVEEIAKAEELKIDQKDIMEHINQMSMMYGMAPSALFEQLRQNPSSYAVITQQITANKVNEFLLENNKFIAK